MKVKCEYLFESPYILYNYWYNSYVKQRLITRSYSSGRLLQANIVYTLILHISRCGKLEYVCVFDHSVASTLIMKKTLGLQELKHMYSLPSLDNVDKVLYTNMYDKRYT